MPLLSQTPAQIALRLRQTRLRDAVTFPRVLQRSHREGAPPALVLPPTSDSNPLGRLSYTYYLKCLNYYPLHTLESHNHKLEERVRRYEIEVREGDQIADDQEVERKENGQELATLHVELASARSKISSLKKEKRENDSLVCNIMAEKDEEIKSMQAYMLGSTTHVPNPTQPPTQDSMNLGDDVALVQEVTKMAPSHRYFKKLRWDYPPSEGSLKIVNEAKGSNYMFFIDFFIYFLPTQSVSGVNFFVYSIFT